MQKSPGRVWGVPKGGGTLSKKECWKTEEPFPKKIESCSVNTKSCTKKLSQLCEDVESKDEER